jgi:hypothetical protein
MFSLGGDINSDDELDFSAANSSLSGTLLKSFSSLSGTLVKNFSSLSGTLSKTFISLSGTVKVLFSLLLGIHCTAEIFISLSVALLKICPENA